jgi:hypothetical protein
LNEEITANMDSTKTKGQFKFDGAGYALIAPDALAVVAKNITLL